MVQFEFRLGLGLGLGLGYGTVCDACSVMGLYIYRERKGAEKEREGGGRWGMNYFF